MSAKIGVLKNILTVWHVVTIKEILLGVFTNVRRMRGAAGTIAETERTLNRKALST